MLAVWCEVIPHCSFALHFSNISFWVTESTGFESWLYHLQVLWPHLFLWSISFLVYQLWILSSVGCFQGCYVSCAPHYCRVSIHTDQTGSYFFSVKGQIVNILGLASHRVSASTAQPCCCSTKSAIREYVKMWVWLYSNNISLTKTGVGPVLAHSPKFAYSWHRPGYECGTLELCSDVV